MRHEDPHISKKKHMIPQQSYLHDDLIIEEILTRLPVKSVLRFKSVSKQWYSTLSSPDFANAHLIKSPFSHPTAPVNTLFIMDFTSFYVFSYDDDQISGNFKDNLVKLDPGFSVEKDTLELTGSCNGLICLTSASAEYFILWNPATRNLNKYGRPHGYIKHFDKANYVYVASGFGYASSVDDYKYVGILIAYQGNEISDCIVCIFSLKENRWRKIDFGNDHISVFGQARLVSEKLYWYAYSEEAGDLLLSFDLGIERFDVIKNMDLDRTDLLGVMSGCLSIFYCDQFSDLMHILDPPAIVKSIELPEGLSLDEVSEMIGFTKTGKLFVTGPSGYKVRGFFTRTLGIVDTCTKPMKYTKLLRFNKLIEISRYVPSLLSPFPIEPSKG